MIPLGAILGTSPSPVWEAIKVTAIVVAVAVSATSFYFSKMQKAKIKAIEIQEQTPMGPAQHVIVFTNYGNKTGVVIGPELVSEDDKMRISLDGKDELAYPVEPHGTKILKFDVNSRSRTNQKYRIRFRDHMGKDIELSEHAFLNEVSEKKNVSYRNRCFEQDIDKKK